MRVTLELELPRADHPEEEQSSCDDDDDHRRRNDLPDSSSSSPDPVVRSSAAVAPVVRMVSADDATLSSPVQRGQGDAATERRKIGVAARFVSTTSASTPRPERSKSSDAGRRSHHSASRASRASTPHESSTSSASSSSSESLPDGYSRVARCLVHTSELDERRLVATCRQLNDSQFYVAELSSTDAKRRLHRCPPATFLVRDSAHPRHLYSLTVKTQRGVTSIRTVYDVEGFRLDSDPDQVCDDVSGQRLACSVSQAPTAWG